MELTKQAIITIRNEVFPSNTYFLKSKNNNSCIIIDPGLDISLIDKKIAELSLIPVAIISTHGHFDHIGGVSFFKNKFKIPFYLHEADLKLSRSVNFYLKVAHIALQIETPKPDYIFKMQTEHINIEDFNLTIHHFPGHSPGSCVIKYVNYLFSGDIIYKKGLGFNNFPGENKLLLKESILEMFRLFIADSLVLPGHGEAEYLEKIKHNNQDLINFLSSNNN